MWNHLVGRNSMTEHKLRHYEQKGKGHKDMGGETESPAKLLAPYDTPSFDPLKQGGLLTADASTEAYVRPSYFRRNPEGLTKNDVKGIYLDNKPPEKLGFEHTDSGLEGEYFIFDDQGEMVSAMNPGDPFRTALERFNENARQINDEEIGYTVEMSSNCVELTFDHGTDIDQRNRNYLGTLKSLITIADETGVNIAPIANIPHRRLQPEEITDDPYTQKITFDVQGWDAAQHFDIASIQPHVEVLDHKAARKAINHLQHVSPILLGGTLSGPFMDGMLQPNPEERYADAPGVDGDSWKEATIENLEQGEHQSYRPKGRFFGSPSGGVLRQPIPEEENEFLASIGAKLENGEVPTAGREGGHHTDRYRVDIPPYGTLELCTLDPAGGKTERVIAMREFVRGLGWKMQMHLINGDFPEVQERYPALFGQEPSEASFEIAHHNTMRVAKHGADANLEGMDGKEYTTRELWKQLRDFVQEPLIDEEKQIVYQGLPPGIIKEVSRAFIDPDKTMDKFRDADGITSVSGFYETGIGNISQWMLQGAKDRIAVGMKEQEAVMAVTVDVARSFHEHIKTTTVADIQELYRPKSEAFEVKALSQDAAKTYWNNLISENLVSRPDNKSPWPQLGHPVELPQSFVNQLMQGAETTHQIILDKIKEAGGVTEWMQGNPITFGALVLNNPDINSQLEARLDQGYGVSLIFDNLVARDKGDIMPKVLEISTAMGYETAIAARLQAAGYDSDSQETRFGPNSPAEVYRGFSERFANGEPIVVLDTEPFDATKLDKIGMQKMMGIPDSLPISPADIIGKDENGYYYHPYRIDPEKPFDVLRDADGLPQKDTSQKEYAKHVFARMAQFDLDELYEKVKDNPAKVQLVGEFLNDSSVNWIWHPTWQHLGDKAMLPQIRAELIANENPIARQFVPVFGAGETVTEPGVYFDKPTNAQHGVDQSIREIHEGENVIVEDGRVLQGEIKTQPILTYLPGELASHLRYAKQQSLQERDKASEEVRAVTGTLEVRLLVPPYWERDQGMTGRYMTRYAPRREGPDSKDKTMTNVGAINEAVISHLQPDHIEKQIFYPYGNAPAVVIYEA